MKTDAVVVFVILFVLITVIGFGASRWRRADLSNLLEWGLAGRGFGTLITWFLVGGDLYTAYTFVAVPALVFGKGAIGLFAIPYTVIVYPMVYVILPKLWQVAKNHGYVTASDFVKARFDSSLLALLVAITGIIATIPYIALQIYGIQIVLSVMGLNVEASLIIAFLVLAIFTYVSGLRAPALIAIVKDILIWSTVIIALVVIPAKLGGYGAIFSHVPPAKLTLPKTLYNAYWSLALGSALALMLYPHAITGVLSSRSQAVVKRNAALLPAYSFMLGLIAILGYMAIAAGIHASKAYGANSAIPDLILKMFPGWLAGYAFAAIAIGALVPASVMSIAAANLFSRNIYREYFRRNATAGEEATVSKWVSLIIKIGAVLFIILATRTNALVDIINFQLLGGVWILQTLPAVFLALYVRWLDRWAVALGWLVGIVYGSWMAFDAKLGNQHTVPGFGKNTFYIALTALVANLIVVLIGTAIARALGSRTNNQIADEAYLEATA
jgi:SSS family solute:Na+ symporter